MKRMGWIAATAVLAATAAQAGDVVVTVSGVQARGGTVLAGLQTREQFMKTDGVNGARAESPRAGVLTLTIKNVAPGDYALGVLHDEDGNGVLKLAANGMPAEGVAMVGGEALRGPPTFDQVKFTVPANGAAVKAAMIYFDGKIPTGAR